MDRQSNIHSEQSGQELHPYFFSLNKRSYVNPVTNTMVLSPVQLETRLGQIFVKGQLPTSCMPDFLHEATHHWCFQSCLGITFTLLRLRATRNMLMLLAGNTPLNQVSEEDVLDDFLRYDVLLRLLQPLSEGLALFAEFDVVPTSRSPYISEPFNWASWLFTSRETLQDPRELLPEQRSAHWWEEFSMLLRKTRIDLKEVTKRKRDLLLQPMHCDAGGYLPGYLTVKNAWCAACEICSEYIDKDLFLRFTRDFFYNDLGLVACALNPHTSDVGAAYEIAEYFSKRFPAFYANVKEKVVAFEQAKTPYLIDLFSDAFSDELLNLGTDPPQWKLGGERLRAALRELKDISSTSAEVDTEPNKAPLFNISQWRIRDAWILAQRQLMCIGHMDASISVTAANQVVVKKDDRPILAGPALNELYVGRQGTGSLDVFFSIEPRYIVCAVRLEDDFVLTYFIHFQENLPPDRQQAIEKDFLQYGKIMNVKDIQEGTFIPELLKGYLFQGKEDNSLLLDLSRKRLNRNLYYGRAALTFIPEEERVDQLLNEMNDTGFLMILGKQGDIIQAVEHVYGLALLSLFAASGLDFQGCEEVFEEERSRAQFRGSFQEIVEEIQRKTLAKLGISLISKEDGYYFSFV